MYRGTYDGDVDEIKFVAEFNSNKNRFNDYLSKFSKYKNTWMFFYSFFHPSKLFF